MADRLVLLVLADYADQTGRSWPSVRRIAARAGLTMDATRAALHRLRDAGWLSIEERRVVGDRNRSNVYRLAITSDEAEYGEHEPAPGPDPSLPSEGGHLPPSGQEAPPPLGAGGKNHQEGTVSNDPSTSGAVAPTRPEVERLCELLADLIEQNGTKRPTVSKRWRDACRLLLDRDGRTVDQVERAIRWSQAHEFWRANILSMPTLREKYDTLRLQAMRSGGGGAHDRARDRQARNLEVVRQMAELDAAEMRGLEG